MLQKESAIKDTLNKSVFKWKHSHSPWKDYFGHNNSLFNNFPTRVQWEKAHTFTHKYKVEFIAHTSFLISVHSLLQQDTALSHSTDY